MFEPAFEKAFGKDNIFTMYHSEFHSFISTMLKKFHDLIHLLGEGPQKLSAFSEWLDEYNSSNIADPKNLIEIPGQYKNNIEPQPENHTKVASINKTVLVLGSIRKPKRIEVNGTNEKSYYLLVKGGEDLRLDERIQQLFTIMNQIFAGDTDCRSRFINLKQFAVTPMTNRLGTIEWITDTVPMKKLIFMVVLYSKQ
jgi:DNA-dependent protein kinase catalytic subunit